MRTRDVINSKALKVFIKGAFILIGLFFILSYGIAAFLIIYSNIIINVDTLISFLICFPPILVFLTVIFIFPCMMGFYNDKINNFLYKEHEEIINKMIFKHILEMHKIDMIKEVCPKVVEALKSGFDKTWDESMKKIKEKIDEHSKDKQ